MYQSKLSNNNVDRIFDDFSESVQYPRKPAQERTSFKRCMLPLHSSHNTGIDVTSVTWAARKAQYSWRRSSKPTTQPTTGKCLLTLLPNEVLFQIAEYLLPSNQSFHIFHFDNDYGRRTTMIHRLCPPYSAAEVIVDPVAGNIQPNITALATVCRRLSEVYHAVMYGGNRFIFELGLSAKWPRPIAKSQSGLHNVESWARVYETCHGTLWPLTRRTSAFVKDVTLLITKSYQEANKYERLHLMEQLINVDRLLNPSSNLSQLTVDMSTTQSPHESVSQRLGWKLDGEDDHVLKLRDVIQCSGSCEDCGGFDSLWELLREIRCKHQVVLSGHISHELAGEMRRVMVVT